MKKITALLLALLMTLSLSAALAENNPYAVPSRSPSNGGTATRISIPRTSTCCARSFMSSIP